MSACVTAQLSLPFEPPTVPGSAEVGRSCSCSPGFVAGLAEMFADSARWLGAAEFHLAELQELALSANTLIQAYDGAPCSLRDSVPFLRLRGAWGNAIMALDLPRPAGC